MPVNQLDVTDEAALRQAHAATERSAAVDRPWFEPQPYDEWVAEVRHLDAGERQEWWAAYDGGQVVGTAHASVPLWSNTWVVWVTLHVDPDFRGQGHGTALVEALVERTRELGRTSLMVEFHVPGDDLEGHPYRRFATARGFEPIWVENVRHLPLPVPDDLLDRTGERSAKAATAYDIQVFAGRVPVEHLPGRCELHSLLGVDAPTGSVQFEAGAMTPERMRSRDALEEQQGRVRLTALAIARDTRAVAAHSDLVVPPAPSTQVWQWGTYVHRDHRGHQLGMATKVANLRYLQEHFPGRTLVRTSNADNNAHMVSINEDLGFELVERAPRMGRTVSE
ncbi:GNAT family N-acetyltransferase [Luteipulveratus mongoliensis]|uniref:N-acetyltransferase domain-containing protein n=1 Tax=Luteipulveratus mongoliensis TaxID=571913 RepID=A0A0K1JP65_9MICO|nr:GNAT family N-acetyltransferase [Luteipulveratus mongoliensis]AKU18512.1 hypothetical protein VV02_00870 [Luteipulveratus mongoliensis]